MEKLDDLTPSVDELFPIYQLPIDASNGVWRPVPITKIQSVGFCDWLSIYQRHADLIKVLPKYHDGAYVRLDQHGVAVNTRLKNLRLEGSHETSLFIRCDGETVWFEGNVSRYGRRDNVFGYSFTDCVDLINNILDTQGLPPFTSGRRFITNVKGHPRSAWTGAIVTRVDMTQNFATGCKEDAAHFMRYLAGQQASRLKTGTYGEGETVDWGRGSRNLYSKAYLKAAELRRRAAGSSYLTELADWCDAVGLLRFETTYKTTKLHQMNCHYLGGFDMRQLELDFEERKELLSRQSVDVEDLSLLSKAILGTYRMWQAGDDVAAKMKRATFYLHRKALLPYGVDIAIKSNVTKFVPRTRVITLGPVAPPDFYELPPPIERKRYGNLG
jgi:hypothetical protein